MSLGLVGRKVGMTRVFSDEGVSIPVTVIEVEPNRVAQIKTIETDGSMFFFRFQRLDCPGKRL